MHHGMPITCASPGRDTQRGRGGEDRCAEAGAVSADQPGRVLAPDRTAGYAPGADIRQSNSELPLLGQSGLWRISKKWLTNRRDRQGPGGL